jgi:hypothetical protein
MKSVKIMSIIGIVLFSICFLFIIGATPEGASSTYTELDIENLEASAGIGLMAAIYGIAYAITALVVSNKNLKEDN